jgi:hypothetical protein
MAYLLLNPNALTLKHLMLRLYEIFTAGGSTMEALRKLDNRATDSKYDSHDPGKIIQMLPYFERRGMRAPFEQKRRHSSDESPGHKAEAANLLALLAKILDSTTLPGIVGEFIKMLDEKIRSQKAAGAFEKANTAFEEMRNTDCGYPEIMRKTTGIIRRRKIQIQNYHKPEETHRIHSLTGQIDGNIEDVLVWEI